MSPDSIPRDIDPETIDPRNIDPRTIDHGNIHYATHLTRDSGRFVEVLRQTPAEAPVPTCPDWTADDLLWHLAEVQWFWGTIISRGLTAYADVADLDNGGRPGDREELLGFYERASGDLHHNLSTASPDRPAWTWSTEQTVGFIRRRQAHEALIHRLDAELTAGGRTPMDADLSTDGVDEVLRIMYGALPPWGRFSPDATQTVGIQTTDTGRSWLVTLGLLTGIDEDGNAHDDPALAVVAPDGRVPDPGKTAAATVRGAAADLDCWLWHRPPAGQIERLGDPLVLDRFDQAVAGGID